LLRRSTTTTTTTRQPCYNTATMLQSVQNPEPQEAEAEQQQQPEQKRKQFSSRRSINQQKLEHIKLADGKYRLLHVGKDGGGSIRDRSARAWKLRIQQCHPAPCKKYSTDQNEIPASLLTIRDPVDRFVSAFYYRALNIDFNETSPSCNHSDYSRKQKLQCQHRNMERSYMFDTYHRNVSRLAEMVCDESTRDEAMRNASKIGYLLAHKLSGDWLPKGWDRFENRIFPAVLERGFDFDLQIDDAFEWLHEVEPIEDDQVFRIRKRSSRGRVLKDNLKNAHSSTGAEAGGTQKNIPMSDLGASCLQEYVYADDYQLLKKNCNQTCKTQTCRDAIQSILSRRGVA
jgi:hypothetical protein